MGDELSRDKIMRQALTIKDFVAPGSLPGASINTSFTNYFPLRLLHLARFNGENAHILNDHSRPSFLYFWANGGAGKQARGLRALLNNVNRARSQAGAMRISGALLRLIAVVSFITASAVVAEAETPLTLEQIIPLNGVSGRIDHMAIDAAGKRLFVAELGNGSIDVIDLQAGKAIKRISNLREPQGVAYIPDQDLIVVAGGGDGSVRFYHAADLKAVRTIPLGDDADNIRIDPDDGTILVGYGKGGLAIFDPKTQSSARQKPNSPGWPGDVLSF